MNVHSFSVLTYTGPLWIVWFRGGTTHFRPNFGSFLVKIMFWLSIKLGTRPLIIFPTRYRYRASPTGLGYFRQQYFRVDESVADESVADETVADESVICPPTSTSSACWVAPNNLIDQGLIYCLCNISVPTSVFSSVPACEEPNWQQYSSIGRIKDLNIILSLVELPLFWNFGDSN